MKVFRVWTDFCYNNEYGSMVVVAESKEAVLKMGEHIEDGLYSRWKFSDAHFYDHQGELHIDEVNLSEEQIVLVSFNAR